MKIWETQHHAPLQNESERSRRTGTAGSPGFQEMLDEEAGASMSPAVSGPGETEAVSPAGGLVPFSNLEVSTEGLGASVEAIDHLIESLHRLQQGLESPVVTPRELEGRLEALAQEAEGLRGRFEDLPQDHELRLLAEEIQVLSYVESIKWRRGDYL